MPWRTASTTPRSAFPLRRALTTRLNQASSATVPALGAAGILAAVNAAIPVNAQTQAPIASCNNIEDVLDLNVRDNVPGQQQEHRQERDVNRDSNNTTEILPVLIPGLPG